MNIPDILPQNSLFGKINRALLKKEGRPWLKERQHYTNVENEFRSSSV